MTLDSRGFLGRVLRLRLRIRHGGCHRLHLLLRYRRQLFFFPEAGGKIAVRDLAVDGALEIQRQRPLAKGTPPARAVTLQSRSHFVSPDCSFVHAPIRLPRFQHPPAPVPPARPCAAIIPCGASASCSRAFPERSATTRLVLQAGGEPLFAEITFFRIDERGSRARVRTRAPFAAQGTRHRRVGDAESRGVTHSFLPPPRVVPCLFTRDRTADDTPLPNPYHGCVALSSAAAASVSNQPVAG